MVSSTSAIYSKNPSPGSPRAGASSWSASVGTPHSEQPAEGMVVGVDLDKGLEKPSRDQAKQDERAQAEQL